MVWGDLDSPVVGNATVTSRPTCSLPFLQPFFYPVMIMRSIGLLQIKFPITTSKCMVANKCHAYIKWFTVNIQCIIQLSLVYNCISLSLVPFMYLF